MKQYFYNKLPDLAFILLYEFIEKETRNHESDCNCSNCKMFNDMSAVAEIRYDHDTKVYNPDKEK